MIYKLVQYGFSSRIINLISNMYAKANARVKVSADGIPKLSSGFAVQVGTRQGCNLSPNLFNLYINDLPFLLESENCDAVKLGEKRIQCLMFADDVLLLNSSKEGLQKSLDIVNIFCKRWKLQVNLHKTKVMVFNKKYKFICEMKFKLGGNYIETCSEYVYLGMLLVPSGSFTATEKRLTDRGKKAHACWANTLNQNILYTHNVKVRMRLFDALTKPVLLYNAEVWFAFDRMFQDFSKLSNYIWYQKKPFDKFHSKCCKQFLKLPMNSSNLACLAELGRYPLLYNVMVAILSYWKRINGDCPNRLVESALKSHKCMWYSGGKSNYLENVSNICKLFGLDMNNIPPNYVIKEYISKTYHVFFMNEVKNNKKLELYSGIKKVYRTESYLLSNLKCQAKIALSKFRVSAHRLPIELGRYTNLDRVDRKCFICTQVVGDEYHYFLDCNDEEISRSRHRLFCKLESLIPYVHSIPKNCLFQYLLNAGDVDMLSLTADHISCILKIVSQRG